MKTFASHRLYIPHLDLLLKNHVVEVAEVKGEVVGYYPFTEEIPYTEWLNGIIVLSYYKPIISLDPVPNYADNSLVLYIGQDKKIRSVIPHEANMTFPTLKAYYVTMFNVSEMSFSSDSRILELV